MTVPPSPQISGTLPPSPQISKVGWSCFAALIPGFLFSNVEPTLLNIALPAIQQNLNLSVSLLSWIPLAALLGTAALCPLMGILADAVGRQRIYLSGLALIGLGSIAAMLATHLPILLLGRVLQGIGTAAVVANGLAIVTEQFEEDTRGKALGSMTALMALGGIMAPVLGGAITEELSWRAVFGLELLIIVPGLYLVRSRIPRHGPISSGWWRDIPWVPSGLLVCTTTLAIVALHRGGTSRWQEPWVLGALGLAALTGWLTIRTNRTQTSPLVAPGQLGGRTAWSLVTLAFGSAFLAGLGFALPLYLASSQGLEGLDLGLEVLPFPIGLMVGALFGGRVMAGKKSGGRVMPGAQDGGRDKGKRGTGLPVLAGLVLAALGLAAYSLWGWIALALAGAGLGAFSVGNNEEVVRGQEDIAGTVAGLVGLLRRSGAVVGVAVSGVVLQNLGPQVGVGWIAWIALPAFLAATIAYRQPRGRSREAN